MKNSNFLSLIHSDWVKAFWIFLYSTIISVVGDAFIQAFTSGTYSLDAIHWKEIGATIGVAILSYLQKQLTTNSEGKILKTDPSEGVPKMTNPPPRPLSGGYQPTEDTLDNNPPQGGGVPPKL